MVFANKFAGPAGKNIFTLGVYGLVAVACSSQKPMPEPPLKGQVVMESRNSLLNWHDVTHKSYFGLKGSVKTLIIKPVVLAENGGQVVSDGWKIHFNSVGRVERKIKLNDPVQFKTEYTYSENGILNLVASYDGKKLWRTSKFIYDEGELVRIDFEDKKSRDQQSIKVDKQKVKDGWIEIQKSISTPGLPMYSQFLNDNSLVWNNRGDINNGLGELYYIRTVDGVTSSSVVNNGTVYMQGRGGYRYVYSKEGMLKAVESYNAHANRLFHRTSYQYDDLGLLISEKREVTDSSPFNEAVNESVKYQYLAIDKKGNWLKRKLTIKSKFQSQEYIESRELIYY